MGTLSLDEQRRLADFTAIGGQLGRYLYYQASIPQSDVLPLDQLLVKLHQAAENDLRPTFLAHPDVVEQVYSKWMSRLSQWEKMVAQHGNVVNLAVNALDRISQIEGKEPDALAAKMQLIKDGHFTLADLDEFDCGFHIVMAISYGILGMFTETYGYMAMQYASHAGYFCAQIP